MSAEAPVEELPLCRNVYTLLLLQGIPWRCRVPAQHAFHPDQEEARLLSGLAFHEHKPRRNIWGQTRHGGHLEQLHRLSSAGGGKGKGHPAEAALQVNVAQQGRPLAVLVCRGRQALMCLVQLGMVMVGASCFLSCFLSGGQLLKHESRRCAGPMARPPGVRAGRPQHPCPCSARRDSWEARPLVALLSPALCSIWACSQPAVGMPAHLMHTCCPARCSRRPGHLHSCPLRREASRAGHSAHRPCSGWTVERL